METLDLGGVKVTISTTGLVPEVRRYRILRIAASWRVEPDGSLTWWDDWGEALLEETIGIKTHHRARPSCWRWVQEADSENYPRKATRKHNGNHYPA